MWEASEKARGKHRVSYFFIIWKLQVGLRTAELWPQWIWEVAWRGLRQTYFCAGEMISQVFGDLEREAEEYSLLAKSSSMYLSTLCNQLH